MSLNRLTNRLREGEPNSLGKDLRYSARFAGDPISVTANGGETKARGRFLILSAMLPQLMPAMFSSSLGLLLPNLINVYDMTSVLAGLLVSVSTLMTTLSVALSGALVSQYGERRILLSGMALFVVSLLLCASSQSTEMLLVTFGMIGFGDGLMITPCYSMISLLLPERKGLGAGLVSVAFSIGSLVGPVMTGYLVIAAGWRLPLLALSLIAVATMSVFFLGTQGFGPVREPTGDRRLGPNLRLLIENRELLMVGAGIFLGGLVAAAYTTWTPYFVITKFGLPESRLSYLGTIIGIGLGLGGFGGILVGRMCDKLGGRLTSIVIGVGAVALTSALCLSGSFESTAVLVIGFGFLMNWYWVALTAMSQRGHSVQMQPVVIGTVQTMALVGAILGPSVVGYLAGGSSPSSFTMLMGTAVPYLLFLLIFVGAYRGGAEGLPKRGVGESESSLRTN